MIITATNLLRAVLRGVDNDGLKAREVLRESSHPEACSAGRILKRALDAKPGATHVRYVGRGSFAADDPQLFIVAVEDDMQTTRALGPWNEVLRGKLKTNGAYGSHLVDQAKAELAPQARMIRVVNETGTTIAFSPSTFAAHATKSV